MKKQFFRSLCLTACAAVLFSGSAVSAAANSDSDSITSINFTNDGTYLSGVYAGCTPALINAGVEQCGRIAVLRGSETLADDAAVRTGDTVQLLFGSNVAQSLTVAVTGDATGDGKVSATDLLTVQMAILGSVSLTGANHKAALASGGDSLSASDVLALSQYVLGINAPTKMDGFYNSEGYINAVPVFVGNPGLERYNNSSKGSIFARNPWDMKAYNGKVYIGSGDYDKNASPTYIACFDPETDSATLFQSSIADEQIARFCIIDGKLVAPGIDQIGAFEHYLYLNEDGTAFVDYLLAYDSRVHTFELANFDGKIFAGTGTNTNSARSAVMVSSDGGKTFTDIDVVKDGNVINGKTVGGFSRSREFMEYNGELYTLFTQTGATGYNGLYKYNAASNRFEYFGSIGNLAAGYSLLNKNGYITYMYLQDKFAFAGKYVACNGYLLTSTDMKTFSPNYFAGKSAYYMDMVEVGGKLYVLTATENSDGSFTNAVYSTTDTENCNKVMQFNSSTFMRCMEYVDGMFVFGAGTRYVDGANTDCGSIYRVCVDF